MIGINWQIGGPYGWGVFGLNLAVELARTGRPPVPLFEPMVADFGPIQDYLLAGGWAEQRRLAAITRGHPGQRLQLGATVLHALMGDFRPIETSPFTGSVNAGLRDRFGRRVIFRGRKAGANRTPTRSCSTSRPSTPTRRERAGAGSPVRG